MVCNLEVNRRKSSQKEKFQPRRKVWKLRNPEVRKRFEEVLDIEEKEERNINQLWESTRNGILKATEEECGWTKGPARHLQTWWWNEEVAAIIDVKKTKFKEWHKAKASPEEESKLKEYIEAKKEQLRKL